MAEESLRVIDCRYDLMQPQAGNEQYHAAHIPGAQYADVHDDLSGSPVTDSGRHPLPTEHALNQLFSRLGITEQSQVVVYDDSAGAFAARLWWLLHYMGHRTAAVLDGGWTSWKSKALPVEKSVVHPVHTQYQGHANTEWLVTINDLDRVDCLIDSREPARYRGESEPIDPRAGHIPGAVNRFWKNNLCSHGEFKRPAELKAEFEQLFGTYTPYDAVFYCGSGVTACHNLLATAHAGLEPARLYAGSWSEWCSDAERPIATDNE